MPTVVITITKRRANMPWVLLTESFAYTGNFTQTEIDSVVAPYNAFVKSMPGFLGIVEKIIDATTVILEKKYDTIENLKRAEARLRFDSTEPIVIAKDELFVRKYKEFNIYPYTIKTIYVEDPIDA